jgi:hypothetical protein
MTTMPTPAFSPASVAALRKVFAALEDYFDVDNGCYKAGNSDEKIAKTCGVSADAVKKYRTEAFGKLAAPSEFYDIQRDLRAVEALFLKLDVELKDSIKDLKARLSNVQRKFD